MKVQWERGRVVLPQPQTARGVNNRRASKPPKHNLACMEECREEEQMNGHFLKGILMYPEMG